MTSPKKILVITGPYITVNKNKTEPYKECPHTVPPLSPLKIPFDTMESI